MSLDWEYLMETLRKSNSSTSQLSLDLLRTETYEHWATTQYEKSVHTDTLLMKPLCYEIKIQLQQEQLKQLRHWLHLEWYCHQYLH